MSKIVRWVLLSQGGKITKGVGQTHGIGKMARASVGGAFVVPGFPPVFVAGRVSLIWAVDKIVGGPTSRTWGVEPGCDRRIWLMAGVGIGIGKELEDVEAIAKELQPRVSG